MDKDLSSEEKNDLIDVLNNLLNEYRTVYPDNFSSIISEVIE